MSKMAELDYDIEQLFIEGLTEKNIAKTLDISVEHVYAWMQLNGIKDETDPWSVIEDPHTVN
jgi:orotate phosphoribosyltransferase-like protein